MPWLLKTLDLLIIWQVDDQNGDDITEDDLPAGNLNISRVREPHYQSTVFQF